MLLRSNNISNNILSGAGWVVGWVAGLLAGLQGYLLGCWVRWLGLYCVMVVCFLLDVV
jgi:hypothetical protein